MPSGDFAQGTRQDVEDAIASAKAAYARVGRTGPGRSGSRSCDKAADLISERRNELSALMAMEVGKNRLEALGDVEETADLIRYYCEQIEDERRLRDADGRRWAPPGDDYDVLRPYGVWAVISPFNFPMALAGGPSAPRSSPATPSC